MIAEAGDGSLTGAIEYSTGLFDGVRVEGLAGHLVTVLGGVAGDAGVRLSGVAVLTGREREELGRWNDTAGVVPGAGGVGELVAGVGGGAAGCGGGGGGGPVADVRGAAGAGGAAGGGAAGGGGGGGVGGGVVPGAGGGDGVGDGGGVAGGGVRTCRWIRGIRRGGWGSCWLIAGRRWWWRGRRRWRGICRLGGCGWSCWMMRGRGRSWRPRCRRCRRRRGRGSWRT